MRLISWLLRLVLVPLWLLGVGIYLFCFFHSVTITGRAALTGLALVCSVVLLMPCFCLPLRSCSRRRRLGFLAAWAIGVLLLAPLPLLSPSGEGGDEQTTVEHVYYDEQARPSRYSVGWMVPEVDQIAMGQGLARWVDPNLDAGRAARLRRLSVQIYRELDEDPALGDMGSMLGASYDEGMLSQAPQGGHYLAMVPQKAPAKKRMPLAVFLHGSAGAFSSYWKVLAPLVRKHGAAVICPTFGFGNWGRRRGGVAHVLASIKHARKRYPVISGRTYLVGLSNGGTGVSPAVARCKGCFAGAAYVSGVISRRAVARGVKRGAWRELPVLVIHGGKDLRIPPWAIRPAVKKLSEGGVRLSRLDFPKEDHFLFFAKRDQVVRRLARWMNRLGR